MVDLKSALSRFLAIPGVRQAILVGRDGLMIEGLTRDGKDDMEAVGAIMTTGLNTAEALGQEISRGNVIGVLRVILPSWSRSLTMLRVSLACGICSKRAALRFLKHLISRSKHMNAYMHGGRHGTWNN
jgi:hypothetical protein